MDAGKRKEGVTPPSRPTNFEGAAAVISKRKEDWTRSY
jgi:hypothetical protein